MYNSFILQGKERKNNHTNVRKTYYWKSIFVICCYSTWKRRHLGTKTRKARYHVSTQDILAREHVSFQSTLARGHVSTQGTLARGHVSIQSTLAGGHVRHARHVGTRVRKHSKHVGTWARKHSKHVGTWARKARNLADCLKSVLEYKKLESVNGELNSNFKKRIVKKERKFRENNENKICYLKVMILYFKIYNVCGSHGFTSSY